MKKRIPPKIGQESVWDYPRPPRLEKTNKHLIVEFQGTIIVDTTNAYRVLETSHPPTYYIPPADIKSEYLRKVAGKRSFCEFKGSAVYWNLKVGTVESPEVAWSYPDPSGAYAAIQDYLSFYASRVDACYVNDEQVQAQEGDFYGGWITSDIVGPFKGGTGTWGW